MIKAFVVYLDKLPEALIAMNSNQYDSFFRPTVKNVIVREGAEAATVLVEVEHDYPYIERRWQNGEY